MIETSQLQTILAVARSGSFSKAAEDLNVTQSAISQTIKNVETKVGAKIFKRSGRNVVLTIEGERLSQLASDFLKRLDDTLQKIQENKNSMTGKIRIGTHSGLGKSWVAPKMVEFITQYPEVSMEIRMAGAKTLVSEFEQFHLDCLVLPEGDLPHSGEKVLIGTEYIGLVFPKNGPYRLDPTTGLDVISEYPVLMFEDMDPLYFNWCRGRFGRVPSSVNKRLVVNSHGNILYGVSKGLGVSVVPTHVLKRSFYKDKIATLGKKAEVSNGNLYFVYHEESKDFLRIQKLIEEFVKEFAEHPFGEQE